MNFQHHAHPDNLERYSFLWSEVRLVVAAVSLLIGGVPVVYKIFGFAFFGVVQGFLTLCWIISGLASLYLLYRWIGGGQKLFGRKDSRDLTAFLVSVISGLNLGLVGLSGRNFGMSISPGYMGFVLAGIIYIIVAVHLYMRWNSAGQKLFHQG